MRDDSVDPTTFPTERRDELDSRYDRVAFFLNVLLYVGDEYVHGVVEHLSMEEVFVATSRRVPIDTEIAFDLDLPDGNLRVRGTVCWVRDGSRAPAVAAGLGIRLDEISLADRMRLRAFLDDRRDGGDGDGGGAVVRIAPGHRSGG